MITKELIAAIVNEKLDVGPLFLVDVHVKPGNKIAVELDSDQKVSIDDCAQLSKHIEASFDREVEDFELEVSSAGMGRPLKVKRQYAKHIGKEVSVRTVDGDECVGTLTAAGLKVVLNVPASKKTKLPERQVEFDWNQIKECKVKFVFK